MKFKSEIDLFRFMEKFFYAEALSDILDARGCRDCVVSPKAQVRPLIDAAVCAGRVRTLLNAPGKPRGKNPYELAFKLIDSLRPGDVPVTGWRQVREPGIMGELSATAMRKRGARGCLVDGYTTGRAPTRRHALPSFRQGPLPPRHPGAVGRHRL